jgi:hypothetical protein
MTTEIQLIQPAAVRTVAGGPGIEGRRGVLYQTIDETPSRMLWWDGSVMVPVPTSAQAAAVAAAEAVGGGAIGLEQTCAMTMLPGFIDGRRQNNCIGQDNIIYYGGYHWCVYWNGIANGGIALGAPVLARKAVGSTAWTAFDLSTISGAPLGTQTTGDNHYQLTLMISGDGQIHVSGNIHVTALRYVRGTVAAWSTAGSWSSPGMVGAQEAAASYPTFVDLGGDLLFLHRNGSSGSAVWYINRYSVTTGLWTRVCQLFGLATIPGGSGASSAYPTRIVYKDGVLHIAFTYRSNGALADSNYCVFYARSTDFGVTWKSIGGTTLTLPIEATAATSAIAMATAATGSGLLNSGFTSLAIDSSGNPWMAYQLLDGSNYTQVQVVYRSGGAWANTAVTQYTYRYDLTGAIADGTMARPDIFCSEAGKTYVIMRHNAAYRGSVRLIDVTTPSAPAMGVLVDIDLYSWEPNYSAQVLQTTGKVMFLAHACAVADSVAPAIDYEFSDRFTYQRCMVVSVDPESAGNIVAGCASVPKIEIVEPFKSGGMPVSGATSFTSTTAITSNADPGTQCGGPGLRILADWKQQPLVIRMTALVRKTSGGTVKINIRDNYGDGSVALSTTTVGLSLNSPNAQGVPFPVRAPWISTPGLLDSTKYSYIELFGVASDSTNCNVWSWGLDLGRYALGPPARWLV